MKKTIMPLIILCFSLSTTLGQSIRLNLGDEFSYRHSTFSHKDNQNPADEEITQTESFDCQQVNFKVTEVLPHHYKLTAHCETVQHYDRSKNESNEQWKTGQNYDKPLKNQYTTFYSPDYDAEFILTDKGEIKETVILTQVSLDKDHKNNVPDSILVRLFEGAINGFFFNHSKKLKRGQTIIINEQECTVEEIVNNQLVLTSTSNGRQIQSQLKYDLNKGLLLERNSYEDSHGKNEKSVRYPAPGEREEITYKTDERRIVSTRLIVDNHKPFQCRFRSNDCEKDTVFTTTNVRIRGKIKNPRGNGDVAIHFNENAPSAYYRNMIISKVAEDNTFELRFHLDQPREVSFRQREVSSIYLAPGDDVYIEVDLDAFDETITATGIGSDKLNHCFQKFRFDEEEKSSIRRMQKDRERNCKELSPQEYKNYYLDLLEKRQAYLNSHCKWILPEQYLAEYWETQTTIVSILSSYPDNQKYYRKQAGKQPFEIDKNVFFDSAFYSLIHPDNDLIAFYDNYDHFIREYVFFFLDKKLDAITGKGAVITVNNFFDNLYYSNYGFSNSFFTGTTQHVLKYQTVCDALKQANWDCFVDLYKQFIAEYPDAPRTDLLTEAYHKAEKVAPGQFAYNFELSDFEGNKVKLSDFKGKVVYIDFWATSCGPCVGSIKKYGLEMQEAFKDTDVVLLYVALENDVERPKKLMSEQGIEGVHLIAKGKEESLIREKYFFNAIPRYYLIDKEGRIVEKDAPDPYQIVKDHSLLLSALEPQ
ncbi:TlpA family protein disulfide reductase [Mangrovibacterium diazotrophicum]|uniref:Thiol-disulfide isomerase/thioredoxin n=1 Tax=Mangrovibacterium diazotrophicum TaxID=1261403 RepID=A0A419W864_9BACT|nr:TlpA disulfide reductase family protein [Mangrovibacterium diazotrophicum]RKD91663.1 thiol-disulfide isomerase/thioredoxin [Mangrovibacterium diazotrophicum]